MSDMKIEIINCAFSTVTKGNKSYQVADVAFKNLTYDGKVEGKKIMSFADKAAFDVMSTAKQGDVYDVHRVKNDAGYWSWQAVTKANGSEAANGNPSVPVSISSVATTKVPKNNYETTEERAARQVMIVRQSSIASAVNFVNALPKGADHTVEIVLNIAKEFEDFVLGQEVKDVVQSPEEAMHAVEDDIPF